MNNAVVASIFSSHLGHRVGMFNVELLPSCTIRFLSPRSFPRIARCKPSTHFCTIRRKSRRINIFAQYGAFRNVKAHGIRNYLYISMCPCTACVVGQEIEGGNGSKGRVEEQQ